MNRSCHRPFEVGNNMIQQKTHKPGSPIPAYLSLNQEQWDRKIHMGQELMSPCMLCARRCRALRLEASYLADCCLGPKGICAAKDKAVVASVGPHFGEEPPLVGQKGSGTIFFCGCNLKCSFCQNYDIAHYYPGQEVADEELGTLMLQVQKMGCHNINLVSPTHVAPNILAAVRWAAQRGLNVPLVYNTGGYDSLETLTLFDGVVDIYMPDMKYGASAPAREFSQAKDYPEVNFAAVKEMHRQVGDLIIEEDGVAVRGLLVRHLVLPQNMAATEQVMKYIADKLSLDTYVNIMAQYRPCYKAVKHPVLGRRITTQEYRQALQMAAKVGLIRAGGH